MCLPIPHVTQRMGVVLLLLSAVPLHAFAQASKFANDATTPQSERDQLMKEMQIEAESLKVLQTTAAASGKELRLREKPVFRHNSPTRVYRDGSLWIWPAEGQPITFAKIFLMGTPGAERWIWSCASARPIEAILQSVRTWYPHEGGLTFQPLPEAPTPADNEMARMRQMKLFTRRFTGHEFWYPGRSRQELRLMPQPVLRYQDPGQSVVDGAVFLMAHEIEPECILMIQAVAGEGKTVWQYGALAVGSAEFHIELDGKEFYTREWAKNDKGLPTESYYVIVTPRRS